MPQGIDRGTRYRLLGFFAKNLVSLYLSLSRLFSSSFGIRTHTLMRARARYAVSWSWILTGLVLLGDHGGAMPLQLSAELGDDGMQFGKPFLVSRRLLFRALLGAGRLHLRPYQRGLGRLPRASSRHQPRVQLGHLGPQRGERGRVQL